MNPSMRRQGEARWSDFGLPGRKCLQDVDDDDSDDAQSGALISLGGGETDSHIHNASPQGRPDETRWSSCCSFTEHEKRSLATPLNDMCTLAQLDNAAEGYLQPSIQHTWYETPRLLLEDGDRGIIRKVIED
jgi:hypothetical protein